MLTAFIIGVIAAVTTMLLVGWRANRVQASSLIPPTPTRVVVVRPTEPPKPRTKWAMKVSADGREAFTPEPLSGGRIYRLTFSGVVSYTISRFFSSEERQADAAFSTDERNNFKRRYRGIEVDGVTAQSGELDSWTEDRANHVYTCQIEGVGRHIPIRLEVPSDGYGSPYEHLRVDVELLPEDTPSILQRRVELRRQETEAERAKQEAEGVAEQQRQEQQRQQAEEAERRKAEQKAEAEQKQRAAKIFQLSLKVKAERNFLDSKFREHFVRAHHEQLVGPWKTEWTEEYAGLMANSELVKAIRVTSPEIIEWYERRIDMLVLAQRLAVAPPPPEQDGWEILQSAVPITYRTLDKMESLVTELFTLRDECDGYKQLQARSGNACKYSAELNERLRVMAVNYEVLRRYGVDATTPEEAESQLRTLWPLEPVKTPYEQIEQRIYAGQRVGVDIICRRLKDLFAEDCILVWHRKRALRRRDMQLKDEVDQDISQARAECAKWLDFLRSQGVEVEFGPEKDETLDQGVLGLFQQQQKIKAALTAADQPELIEALDANFAEAYARLFNHEDQSYT